jgi:hypothetical protein
VNKAKRGDDNQLLAGIVGGEEIYHQRLPRRGWKQRQASLLPHTLDEGGDLIIVGNPILREIERPNEVMPLFYREFLFGKIREIFYFIPTGMTVFLYLGSKTS